VVEANLPISIRGEMVLNQNDAGKQGMEIITGRAALIATVQKGDPRTRKYPKMMEGQPTVKTMIRLLPIPRLWTNNSPVSLRRGRPRGNKSLPSNMWMLSNVGRLCLQLQSMIYHSMRKHTNQYKSCLPKRGGR